MTSMRFGALPLTFLIPIPHHHGNTQRTGHTPHTADPGATKPAKCPDPITTCRPASTTHHNQTSKDHCAHCRRDNCPLYEPPTESSLGVQSILKSLTLIQHSLDIQNPMWKLVGLKLRISGVLQTLSYLSRKIHLILAVTTVVLPSLYVLWGTRSGTCRVFVYMLLREIPWEYRAGLYIVAKDFSKGSRRRRNREKRFSIHGEIKGTR